MASKTFWQTTTDDGADCPHKHTSVHEADVCKVKRESKGEKGVRIVKVHQS